MKRTIKFDLSNIHHDTMVFIPDEFTDTRVSWGIWRPRQIKWVVRIKSEPKNMVRDLVDIIKGSYNGEVYQPYATGSTQWSWQFLPANQIWNVEIWDRASGMGYCMSLNLVQVKQFKEFLERVLEQ